jgi:hypothetical protein
VALFHGGGQSAIALLRVRAARDLRSDILPQVFLCAVPSHRPRDGAGRNIDRQSFADLCFAVCNRGWRLFGVGAGGKTMSAPAVVRQIRDRSCERASGTTNLRAGGLCPLGVFGVRVDRSKNLIGRSPSLGTLPRARAHKEGPRGIKRLASAWGESTGSGRPVPGGRQRQPSTPCFLMGFPR